jgi:hypothetical protein
VLIGCAIFVPLGLIGVMGARKILDELARQQFEAKRAVVGASASQ